LSIKRLGKEGIYPRNFAASLIIRSEVVGKEQDRYILGRGISLDRRGQVVPRLPDQTRIDDHDIGPTLFHPSQRLIGTGG
jgi:hypothetical protein